jgi:hypothetical protein
VEILKSEFVQFLCSNPAAMYGTSAETSPDVVIFFQGALSGAPSASTTMKDPIGGAGFTTRYSTVKRLRMPLRVRESERWWRA